jgi:hypothetical protein
MILEKHLALAILVFLVSWYFTTSVAAKDEKWYANYWSYLILSFILFFLTAEALIWSIKTLMN